MKKDIKSLVQAENKRLKRLAKQAKQTKQTSLKNALEKLNEKKQLKNLHGKLNSFIFAYVKHNQSIF